MKRSAAVKTRPQWVREDRLPTLEEIAWLQSAEGRAACRAMMEGDPADTPAAIDRWRQRLDPTLVSAAWAQVCLRRAAAVKFARADEMLFDRVGLEQSTDEALAVHKTRRFTGLGRVADLCCGLGGDALALAADHEVVAVDRLAIRTALARHNADVYGQTITAQVGDVTLDLPAADAAHIDPDRRATGRRSHDVDSASPGLVTLQRVVEGYPAAGIKLSPGADFDKLPFTAEIELISQHGECKQAVAWTGRLAEAHRRATVLLERAPNSAHSGFDTVQLAAFPGDSLAWPESCPPHPDSYLYEPDPAVIRADLVGILARKLGLAPIDPHIAWLVGQAPIHDPLVHSFRVIDVRSWSAKPARAWLAEQDIGPLDVKTRGFAARPETILKQLRPAGARPAVLFLTRLGDRPTAILAERLPGSATSKS